jgi:hypothetical protein
MWLPKKGRHTGLPLRLTKLFFDMPMLGLAKLCGMFRFAQHDIHET